MSLLNGTLELNATEIESLESQLEESGLVISSYQENIEEKDNLLEQVSYVKSSLNVKQRKHSKNKCLVPASHVQLDKCSLHQCKAEFGTCKEEFERATEQIAQLTQHVQNIEHERAVDLEQSKYKVIFCSCRLGAKQTQGNIFRPCFRPCFFSEAKKAKERFKVVVLGGSSDRWASTASVYP